MKRLMTVAACAVLAASCTPQKAAAPAGGAKFNTELTMPEFMGHVVDPAAFMYWKNSGSVVDEKGEHDLTPTTDEGWDVLVSGASILMEAGNALQLENRALAPQADWYKYAQQLTAQAKVARAAAEKHDKAAVYEEGAKLYQVCVDCHEQYVIQPGIKANGPAKGNPLPDWPSDIKAKIEGYVKSHGLTK